MGDHEALEFLQGFEHVFQGILTALDRLEKIIQRSGYLAVIILNQVKYRPYAEIGL